jgi:hypothetical protein
MCKGIPVILHGVVSPDGEGKLEPALGAPGAQKGDFETVVKLVKRTVLKTLVLISPGKFKDGKAHRGEQLPQKFYLPSRVDFNDSAELT